MDLIDQEFSKTSLDGSQSNGCMCQRKTHISQHRRVLRGPVFRRRRRRRGFGFRDEGEKLRNTCSLVAFAAKKRNTWIPDLNSISTWNIKLKLISLNTSKRSWRNSTQIFNLKYIYGGRILKGTGFYLTSRLFLKTSWWFSWMRDHQAKWIWVHFKRFGTGEISLGWFRNAKKLRKHVKLFWLGVKIPNLENKMERNNFSLTGMGYWMKNLGWFDDGTNLNMSLIWVK